MDKLNKTQERIYAYLLERAQASVVPPTVREIGTAVGLKSTSSVQGNLDALEKAGYITRDPGLKRNIHLNVGLPETKTTQVPLLGTVTAGQPILAVEEIEGYVPFNGAMSSDKTYFALRVKGESMINAGILDGDIIIAERTPEARNGDKVVALIEDEATVKTFYKENDEFRLQPENDYMEPIICDEVAILGRVVASMRYYN
ncbi:MAG: transcriptional repressor LexA [Clostridiales bacterium]|jgi:repressor LexA|nr:transcriptional repressor LexA [Clostridia bacterium]MBR1826371.1 transcriptional repressor LexA [Clostridia bacterium]MDO4406776.1 transcriptional repressor LexA [Eubacteriales bacterium]NLD30637.1 transcriptional repressor LexA [Clostridiales bacterium]